MGCLPVAVEVMVYPLLDWKNLHTVIREKQIQFFRKKGITDDPAAPHRGRGR
jgi:hypothetical protein